MLGLDSRLSPVFLVLILSWLVSAASLENVSNTNAFDYIIVGGGTCGLVIANRLSENPAVTVVIIEPGPDVRADANVTSMAPHGWLANLGSSIDWQDSSVSQPGAANRSLEFHAGRAIGGTSTINGMTYIRADKAEIDAWETLGSEGWNWDTLLPYYKKVENFTRPSAAQAAAGATYDPNNHGSHGPVKTGYPFWLQNGSLHSTLQQAWEALSYPLNPDVNGGDTYGFSIWPQTTDPAADIRWDAARAYYWPVAGRPNLRLVRGTVTSITWAKRGALSGLPVANGVDYITPDRKKASLRAAKEVVLSAGALRTPLVLEASGIGQPSILEKLGVATRVNLSGVGENLQDQPNSNLVYSGNDNVTGLTPYVTFVKARDLFGCDTATVASSVRASLAGYARAVAAASGGQAVRPNALERIFSVQHRLLFRENVTAGEIIVDASGPFLTSVYWTLLPFSRGSVHLGSTERIDKPVIEPRFFLADFDLTTQVAIGRLSQQFWNTKPARDLAINFTSPGLAILPDNATDDRWASYTRETFSPNNHLLGSAAMMARELGGVVDAKLKVYGTANVRVVDASILPLQFSGHLTATLYAVAERAADLMRQ